jgi:hypothetical protein
MSVNLTARGARKPAWAGVIMWPTVPQGGMGKREVEILLKPRQGRHKLTGSIGHRREPR